MQIIVLQSVTQCVSYLVFDDWHFWAKQMEVAKNYLVSFKAIQISINWLEFNKQSEYFTVKNF
jgi:hypothetical protein